MKIVFSLDYDDCIGREEFANGIALLDKIEHLHAGLLAYMVSLITTHRADKCDFMIFSNRQSYPIDRENAKKGCGSCFPVYQAFPTVLQKYTAIPCALVPYLMADTFGHLDHGTSYLRALEQIEAAKEDARDLEDKERAYYAIAAGDKAPANHPFFRIAKENISERIKKYKLEHPETLLDDSKLSLIFAQLNHLVLNSAPDEPIVYYAFDDREDILQGLIDFLNDNTDLIPSTNCQVKFVKYKPSEGCLMAFGEGIQGSGVVHQYYEQTVIAMARHALWNTVREYLDLTNPASFAYVQVDCLKHIDLTYFKKNITLNDGDVPLPSLAERLATTLDRAFKKHNKDNESSLYPQEKLSSSSTTSTTSTSKKAMPSLAHFKWLSSGTLHTPATLMQKTLTEPRPSRLFSRIQHYLNQDDWSQESFQARLLEELKFEFREYQPWPQLQSDNLKQHAEDVIIHISGHFQDAPQSRSTSSLSISRLWRSSSSTDD